MERLHTATTFRTVLKLMGMRIIIVVLMQYGNILLTATVAIVSGNGCYSVRSMTRGRGTPKGHGRLTVAPRRILSRL